MSRSALRPRLVVACLALALQALPAPFLAAQDSRGPLGTTIIRDVMVPMRDGVGLATDIYLPTRNGAPLEDPDHARHAVEAALACQERLAEMASVFAGRRATCPISWDDQRESPRRSTG